MWRFAVPLAGSTCVERASRATLPHRLAASMILLDRILRATIALAHAAGHMLKLPCNMLILQERLQP
jgi:hypothetical protein